MGLGTVNNTPVITRNPVMKHMYMERICVCYAEDGENWI